MNVIDSVHPEDFRRYDTALIRQRFLIKDLMMPGQINFTYTQYDRMIVGGAVPLHQPLELISDPRLRASYFLERRELGIINVGGGAVVTADGQDFALEKLDCLYIGKGVKSVSFRSRQAD